MSAQRVDLLQLARCELARIAREQPEVAAQPQQVPEGIHPPPGLFEESPLVARVGRFDQCFKNVEAARDQALTDAEAEGSGEFFDLAHDPQR
jgi:hypothetical protein